MSSKSCPLGFICFNMNIIIYIILIVIVIFFLVNHYIRQSSYIVKQTINTKNQERPSPQSSSKSSTQEIKQSLDNIKDIQEILLDKQDEQQTRNLFRRRIHDPLEPPERTYQHRYRPSHDIRRGVRINIKTRGEEPDYQQIGVLIEKDPAENKEPKMLPLFGKRTYRGSQKWNYYTSTDQYNQLKIPVQLAQNTKNCTDEYGCKEIDTQDGVWVPAYQKNFNVEIYSLDSPKYIPYL